MNCGKCGQKLDEGAAFCGNCGQQVLLPPPNPLQQKPLPQASSVRLQPLSPSSGTQAALAYAAYAQPAPSKSSLPIISMVLGIIGFLTGIFIIGGPIGVAAVTTGILGLKKSHNKGMSIAGIVLGGLAALAALFVGLVLAIGNIGDLQSANVLVPFLGRHAS